MCRVWGPLAPPQKRNFLFFIYVGQVSGETHIVCWEWFCEGARIWGFLYVNAIKGKLPETFKIVYDQFV